MTILSKLFSFILLGRKEAQNQVLIAVATPQSISLIRHQKHAYS
ncbi:hypothetical protein [uncultured Polaribacter sp.]